MDRGGHTCRILLLLAAVVCCGRVAAAGQADDEFRVAAGHYQSGRWELAAEAFEAFGRQFPEHALTTDARFYLAEALAQNGQFAQAAQILDQLIRDSLAGDRLKRAMFRRGEAAYLARDIPAAKDYLTAFQTTYPDDELLAHTLAYLGEVHAHLHEHAAAAAAYRACLDGFPSGPLATPCKAGLARALVYQELHGEAELLFADLATSDDPAVARHALLELVRLASTQRDFEAARRHSEDLIARGERLNAPTQLLYAEALHETGDASQADEQYRAVSSSGASEALRQRALYGRLRLVVEQGDLEVLKRLASQFLRDHRDSPLACNVYAALGETGLFQRNYESASAAYAHAIDSGAKGKLAAQCHAGRAVCVAALGELEAARRHLSVLSENHRQHWDVSLTAYRVAELAYAAGLRSDAADLFQDVAQTTASPDLAARALAGLAWAQLRQEDLVGSADAFEQLLEEYPDDPRAAEAGLLRAHILERRSEYDAALAAYHRVIDQFQNHDVLSKSLYFAGRLHDRLEQNREARSLYERLVDDVAANSAELAGSPFVADALYHLGWLLEETGERSAAIERWQSIHSQGDATPHWREATYLLARAAVDDGNFGRARELVPLLIDGDVVDQPLDASASSTPQENDGEITARSLVLAAQLAMQDDAWKEARGHLARIAECRPPHSLGLLASFWIAEADYRLGEFDSALAAFEKLQPETLGVEGEWVPFVPLRRAQLLAHRKQWHEAMAAAQDVVEHHPEFELAYEAHYVLGRGHASQGEFDTARQAYQAVIDSQSGGRTETSAMAQWMIGESYLHQRNYNAALRAFLRGEILYAYSEWQARSLLQAGKCYELLDELDKAEATYQRLIERFPDAEVADEVRARMHVVARQVAGRRN